MTGETMALVGLGSGVMLLLAVVGGAVLGWADRRFFGPVDPRVERINRAETEAARELFQQMARELPFDPRVHWRR